MKFKRLLLFAVVVSLFLLGAGCIQPPVNLGCCLKANATNQNKCVLYNTTSFIESNLKFMGNGCDIKVGSCNITLPANPQQIAPYTGNSYNVTICTQNDIVACIAPNCLAMVCGDFKFKPRIGPGISPEQNTSDKLSDAGNVPADSGEGSSLSFYKAQCRFLPMDARLKGIMKTSKSQIDIFRLGVGESFDEFDKYRYYFPISDPFCSINPPGLLGDLRVDRYMNYLKPDGQQQPYSALPYNPLDPKNGITKNCLPANAALPPPFTFEQFIGTNTLQQLEPKLPPFTYENVIPDHFGYKFATYIREDYSIFSMNGQVSPSPFFNESGVFKALDKGFYRKWLSIAYTDNIYGIKPGPNQAQLTRAPFECDASGNECYSGSCSTQTYGRSVLLSYNKDPTLRQEVVADCNSAADPISGSPIVVCAPTLKVTPKQGAKPDIQYATIGVSAAHLELAEDYNPIGCAGGNDPCNGHQSCNGKCGHRSVFYPIANYKTDDLPDPEKPESLLAGDIVWNNFGHILSASQPQWDKSGKSFSISKIFSKPVTKSLSSTFTYETTCACKVTADPNYKCSDDEKKNYGWCPSFTEDPDSPPAGGAVFFGKPGGKIINLSALGDPNGIAIGYAIANPGEFENMMVVKNCGLLQKVPATPGDFGDFGCEPACQNACAGSPDLINKCTAWCDHKTPNPPCTIEKNSPVSDNYLSLPVPAIAFSDKNGELPISWQPLINTFTPYLQDRISSLKSGLGADCGNSVNPIDLAFASMPWVINFERGYTDPDAQSRSGKLVSTYYLSSLNALTLRDRNIYDEDFSKTVGISACNFRHYALAEDSDIVQSKSSSDFYNIAYSSQIYVFKYKPGSGKWGNCSINDFTYLPEVRTYGWCESCAESTLAYQEIKTAQNNSPQGHYLPYQSMKVTELDQGVINKEKICDWDFSKGIGISCFHKSITDISDYGTPPYGTATAATIPEASILKERAGNYLKSGVMPVFDLSDESNWFTINLKPWCAHPGTDECLEKLPLSSPDFKPLFGKMGAVVVIVGRINAGTNDKTKISEIVNRTSIVRQNCFGCLTAFHVSGASAKSFNDTVNFVLSDPLANFNVDVVTYDYAIPFAALDDSRYTASDIVNYSNAVLQSKGKPTMIVGLAVRNFILGQLETDQYVKLFDPFATNQSDFVKAGLIGAIYAPARNGIPGGGKEVIAGIVDVDKAGSGSPNKKFCALEQTFQKASGKSPIAIFSRAQPVGFVDCISCTSLDKAQGLCKQPDARKCDDGFACNLPIGLDPNSAKCPPNVVIDNQSINARCPICSTDFAGKNYACTLKHGNGTIEIQSGKMSYLTYDGYMEVLAGLSRPNKCCLEASAGGPRYTFIKESFEAPLSSPIAFSKTGDPNVDCGLGTNLNDVNKLSSFCGNNQVPIRNYDINCTITK
ncbi:hypothetical protein HY988_06890 [Candidatus Micrarchaeota archaeon]|nr:hypothetical protein [Candidatus Micrarchaeota archaeon]